MKIFHFLIWANISQGYVLNRFIRKVLMELPSLPILLPIILGTGLDMGDGILYLRDLVFILITGDIIIFRVYMATGMIGLSFLQPTPIIMEYGVLSILTILKMPVLPKPRLQD